MLKRGLVPLCLIQKIAKEEANIKEVNEEWMEPMIKEKISFYLGEDLDQKRIFRDSHKWYFIPFLCTEIEDGGFRSFDGTENTEIDLLGFYLKKTSLPAILPWIAAFFYELDHFIVV